MHRSSRLTLVLALALFIPAVASADSSSYTGTLANPQDTYTLAFSVSGTLPVDVTVQTWGFGGGTNATGAIIAPGGFDPFIGIFDGTGPSASIATDGLGDPYGTSDVLSNFAGFAGCPLAGTVNLGGSSICGDITMSLLLAPGSYTLLLSDADYIPNAVFDNGTLGEGFTDFTGGALQTCNTDATGSTTCADDSANWAFDITTKSKTVNTPEPQSFLLLASALLALMAFALRNARTGAS